MKRASTTYRLQLIKEVVTRRERQLSNDPMVNHIQHLLTEQPPEESHHELNGRFHGNHFDEHAGGWISDDWGLK